MSEFLQPEQPQKKGWFGRNWAWAVPVGCLGMIMMLALIIGGIFVIGMTAIKSVEPYKTALETAKTHPAVIEIIGSPVEKSYFVVGDVNLNNDDGEAKLAFPVFGPKGRGTIYIEAVKTDGKWTTKQLLFIKPDDVTKIDLLGNQPALQPPSEPENKE